MSSSSSNDPHPFPDFTGRVIGPNNSSRYHILNKIGHGAFGVVHRALETSTSPPEERAVKCMKRFPAATPQAAYQAQEIRMHRKASVLPCVATLYDTCYSSPFSSVEEGEGYVYVVMQLLPRSLYEVAYVDRDFRRDDTFVRKMMLRVIDAVRELHRMGVYHGDVKPRNIMLNSTGSKVFLIDFGFATEKGESRNFDTGSPTFMSPENLAGRSTLQPYSTADNDTWAVCMTLFAIVVLIYPWHYADVSRDETFGAFLSSIENGKGRFFIERYAISEAFNVLANRMFDPRGKRMSLDELRSEVAGMERFFMSPKEFEGMEDKSESLRNSYNFLVWPLVDEDEKEGEEEYESCEESFGSGGSSGTDSDSEEDEFEDCESPELDYPAEEKVEPSTSQDLLKKKEPTSISVIENVLAHTPPWRNATMWLPEPESNPEHPLSPPYRAISNSLWLQRRVLDKPLRDVSNDDPKSDEKLVDAVRRRYMPLPKRAVGLS